MFLFFSGMPKFKSPEEELNYLRARVAKREEELIIPAKNGVWRTVPLKTLPPSTMSFFQRIRDESHRFAKKYHHKRREIEYREAFRKLRDN